MPRNWAPSNIRLPFSRSFSPAQRVGQVVVSDFLDGDAILRYSCTRFAPGMEVGGLTQVPLVGGLWVFPDPEEADLAADLPAPLAVVVGCERNGRIGF